MQGSQFGKVREIGAPLRIGIHACRRNQGGQTGIAYLDTTLYTYSAPFARMLTKERVRRSKGYSPLLLGAFTILCVFE